MRLLKLDLYTGGRMGYVYIQHVYFRHSCPTDQHYITLDKLFYRLHICQMCHSWIHPH